MFSYFIENLSLKRESKLDNFLNKKIVPSFFVKNIQFCNYSVPIANEKGLPQTAARTAEKEFKPCLRAVPM